MRKYTLLFDMCTKRRLNSLSIRTVWSIYAGRFVANTAHVSEDSGDD